MQTGAQLTAGFLLTLPFTQRFPALDDFQRDLYLVLVLLAALTTTLILSAVAVHRGLSGEHVKERVVTTAHRLTIGVLTSLGLLITGMVMLIFDVVIDRTFAVIAAVVMAVLFVGLLGVLPRVLLTDREGD
jgi:hypothetical protein